MSAILQTACTSSNGNSRNVSRSETPNRRDSSARDIVNGTNQENVIGNSSNVQILSAPDLDGMTTHAASSVADTSEFPLDFSEDPANQLFAADSDPEDDSEQEASELLQHQSTLLGRSTVRERNVGMSPLFVDTSSATSSPTRSIRPRSPNPSHEIHSTSRHIPSHLSSDRGANINLGQSDRRSRLETGLNTRVENVDGDNIANVIHDGDDAIGPSLNDLLSSNDLIDYNISNHHRHVSHRLFAPSRTRTLRDGQVTSQELSPYTRYYSTELLPRAEPHAEEYAAPAMRYAPRLYNYAGSSLSSRFPQGYISPRRRVALIENGSLTHSTPAYIASPTHYHTNSSQPSGPTMEIVDVDPFLEYVDPVLRTTLPVLPPPILPGYHHDAAGIETGMDVDYYESLANDAVPVAVSSSILRPPPSYSVAVRSLSSPLSTERSSAVSASSNANPSSRMNIGHQTNSHSRHHHRHLNHRHSPSISGGHSITVTTNRQHGGCLNNSTSGRAITHPQLTPRSQTSSASSVSVSVTPRRSGGDRISNANANGDSTSNAVPGTMLRSNDSTSGYNNHRKRAIRDARFVSTSEDVDPERAPKRTSRPTVTVKREVLQQEEPQSQEENAQAVNSLQERTHIKQEIREDQASTSNQESKRIKITKRRESSEEERRNISISTQHNPINCDGKRQVKKVTQKDDIHIANPETTRQNSTTSAVPVSISNHASTVKGEPSKANVVKAEAQEISDVQKETKHYNKCKNERKSTEMQTEDEQALSTEQQIQKSETKEESSDAPNMIQSPQPGPSGIQTSSHNEEDVDPSFAVLQNAPDLQLDCLSSDTEDEVNEDVTVVKISRRRKGTSRKKWNASGRSHSDRTSSTTTINAPPGSIVEVDLTQESDTDDNEIRVDAIHPPPPLSGPHSSVVYGDPYSMDSVYADSSEDSANRIGGGIKLRRFATAPHGALPPNVHSAGSSRGSTPSTTPGPSVHGNSQNSGAAATGGIRSAENISNPQSCSNHDRYCNAERFNACLSHSSRQLPHPDTHQNSCRSHRNYVHNPCNGECGSVSASHEPSPAHTQATQSSHVNRQNRSSSPHPPGVSASRHHSRHLPHSRSSHHLDNAHSSRISNPSFDQWTFRPRRLRAPEGSIAPSASTARSNSTTDSNGTHHHSSHHANVQHQQPHVPNDCPDAHCQLHQNPESAIILGSPPREFRRQGSSHVSSAPSGSNQQTLHRAHQANNLVQQQTQPVDFRRSSSASRSSTETTRDVADQPLNNSITAPSNRQRNEVTVPSRNNDPHPHHVSNQQPPPPPYPSDASDLLRPYHQITLPHSASSFDPGASAHVPRQDQRLLNAVWRMQYHPLRSTRHPSHQRRWMSHQVQQETMRRHMGSAAAAANNAPASVNETGTNHTANSIDLGTFHYVFVVFKPIYFKLILS